MQTFIALGVILRLTFPILSALLLSACATTSVGSIYSATLETGTEPPPRDVFVVIDGTGNSAISRTNAARLFEIVDASGIARNGRQLATYYAEGVGSRGQLLGLAVGSGLDKDVRNAYSFLTKAYTPGKDELVLSGFSRGAYSVRALGGLISYAGIPDLSGNTPKERKQIAKHIFAAYKKKRTDDVALDWNSDPIQKLALEYRFRAPLPSDSAKIRAMVLWDTVGAKGLPNRTTDGTKELDRYYLTACNVELTLHALALDENRNFSFTPISADGALLRKGCENDSNVIVKEVWFAGAHSDVGGSYEEGGLTEGYLPGVSLNWALSQLTKYDILATAPAVFADKHGPIHDAEKSEWYYRPLSEHYRRPFEFQEKFVIEGKPKVHKSVFDRLEIVEDLDNYFPQCPRDTPSNLPTFLCAKELSPQKEPRIPTFVNVLLDRGCLKKTPAGFDLVPDQQCVEVIFD
ncbi:DUF2235 domain-containing protein [Altererythrobacter sp. ZODW24]|uniref:phospholipase effector Tle1 domain-containing protein n=1 Tax=Altererythrobacter sp. ZODW24 TaxID=2185142 RepID=UPI000DF8556E|nr:DUF2235 domain-containing protein [Altererythrobacter sp. ZODW24]